MGVYLCYKRRPLRQCDISAYEATHHAIPGVGGPSDVIRRVFTAGFGVSVQQHVPLASVSVLGYQTRGNAAAIVDLDHVTCCHSRGWAGARRGGGAGMAVEGGVADQEETSGGGDREGG